MLIEKWKLDTFSGFTKSEQEDWTVIGNIQDYIDKLTNDDLMMAVKNKYTLEERTLIVEANLFKHLCYAIQKPDGYELKIEELKRILL